MECHHFGSWRQCAFNDGLRRLSNIATLIGVAHSSIIVLNANNIGRGFIQVIERGYQHIIALHFLGEGCGCHCRRVFAGFYGDSLYGCGLTDSEGCAVLCRTRCRVRIVSSIVDACSGSRCNGYFRIVGKACSSADFRFR